jgi:hypothetical protein
MSNGEVRLTVPRHAPINAYTMGAIAPAVTAGARYSPSPSTPLTGVGTVRDAVDPSPSWPA